MKLFLAAVLALAVAGLAAAAGESTPSAQAPVPAPGLQRTVQDVARREPTPLSRQLSAAERAELRRQLIEYARPPGRPPANPEHR